MTKEKQTLIILSPGFPKDENDTTCLPAHQVFVRALKRNFTELNIVVIAFHYPYVLKNYTWNGIDVISINGRNHGKIKRLATWMRVWKSLKKIKRQQNTIGLLSFWITECALLGKYFGKIHNIKHFSWITGQDAKPNNAFIPLIRPKPGEIFAMSDFLANQFYNNYKIKPPIVIANGIDINLFGAPPINRPIDIFAAGSLIPLKQYDVFIEVVKHIKTQLPNVKAALCGKGPEHEKLLLQTQQLALQENLSFLGEKAHTGVLSLMQQSKIFLHTSNYEGFSTVCLEALYAGAHVISFFRPMEKDIAHWHIVDSKEEMALLAIELLSGNNTDYTPVLPYSIDDISKSVMQLFDIR